MKSSAASADVADLPVLKVLARARAEGRMPHAVLLTGNDGAVLARAAEQLAAMHLGETDPLAHPDCRVLRPAKKSRRIVIENTLEVEPNANNIKYLRTKKERMGHMLNTHLGATEAAESAPDRE